MWLLAYSVVGGLTATATLVMIVTRSDEDIENDPITAFSVVVLSMFAGIAWPLAWTTYATMSLTHAVRKSH